MARSCARSDGRAPWRAFAYILPAFMLLFAAQWLSSVAAAQEPGQPATEGQKEPPAVDRFEVPVRPLDGAIDSEEGEFDPLVPRKPRGAEDNERLEALSLFGAARLLEDRGQHVQALRLYERALRHDPDSLPILREIVPLAFQLERSAEAVRYLLRAVELDPSDLVLLRQLGVHLADERRFNEALELYERASELVEDKNTASHVLLRLEMGRLYYVTDKANEAADAFAEVMKAIEDPDKLEFTSSQKRMFAGESGVRHFTLFAEVFLDADRPDAAMQAYEKIQKLEPNEPRFAYQSARVAFAKKESPAALEQLEKYLGQPKRKEGRGPYELLGQILKETGKQGDFVARLEAIAKADQDDHAVRYVLADQLLAAKEYDRAAELYEKLLEDDGPREESFRGLLTIHSERRAAEPMVKLLGRLVGNRGGFGGLGERVREIAADAALLDELLATARKIHAANADSLAFGDRLAMALLAVEADRYTDAAEFFDLALKINPDQADDLLLTWGIELLSAERYAEAAEIFQRGIDANVRGVDDPTFHFYLAGALEMAGRTEDALAAARVAASRAPGNARIRGRVGWVLYHAKRNEEAEREYRALIDAFAEEFGSEETRAALLDVRLMLSNLAVTKGDIAQAEEWLEQILDEYPENISAMNDLGYIWADQSKNLDRALEMIERAVKAVPDNPAYRDSLGWAYFRLGRLDESVAELRKAAESEDPDGVILDHLGDALAAQGKQDEARQSWQKALEVLDEATEVQRISEIRRKLESNSP